MRLLSLAALLAALVWSPTAALGQTFQVTLTNLTGGQPFSPFVFATPDAAEQVWRLGDAASPGVRQIAEEGDNSVLLADLAPLVGNSVGALATAPGQIAPGQSAAFLLDADPAHPYLSSAWMLGWT